LGKLAFEAICGFVVCDRAQLFENEHYAIFATFTTKLIGDDYAVIQRRSLIYTGRTAADDITIELGPSLAKGAEEMNGGNISAAPTQAR
jgi:hypothetical protein